MSDSTLSGGAEPAAVSAFFGSAEMHASMGAAAQLQSWLDVEAALARAQASLGLIPKSAASAISRAARVDGLDAEAISAETARTGHTILERESVAKAQLIRRTADGWQAAADPRKGGLPAGH